MADKIQKIAFLEQELVQEIENIKITNGLQSRTVDKLYTIVDSIIKSSYSKKGSKSDFNFVPKPRKYWIRLLGTKYNVYLKYLKDNDIIEDNDAYSKDGGLCKKYRISTRFSHSLDLDEVSFKVKGIDGYNDNDYFREFKSFCDKWITEFDDTEFMEVMDKELSSLSPVRQKMKRRYWLTSYESFKRGHLYGNRNDTNQRFDSNLTNMPSTVRELLMKWNGLGEIDMVNSQPTLLSNMMLMDKSFNEKFDGDVIWYNMLCSTGRLYDTLSDHWDVSRDKVKDMVFFVLYSDVNVFKEPHEQFSDLFKPVYDYIVKLKSTNDGYRKFSIDLQKLESSIWIDTFKPLLNNVGIPHTTVHDSVIVNEKDLDESFSLIKHCMKNNEINGELHKRSYTDQ